MGQGVSTRSRGTGLAGVGAADGVLAIDCVINATVRGRDGRSAGGVGVLRRSADQVVVIDDGQLLASCDPEDPTTAVLHACLGQGFSYVGTVTVDEKGATSIDVATTP